MFLLVVWLDDVDRDLLDEVGLSEVEFDWDVLVEDEEIVIVVLIVLMVEELVIRQDENGVILWCGECWLLVDFEIWMVLIVSIFSVDEIGVLVSGEI